MSFHSTESQLQYGEQLPLADDSPEYSSGRPPAADERSAPQNSTQVADSARLFKACGDENRLQILRLLQHDTFGVLELCALLDIKQSAMSHHLKVLSSAGLVESQREGNSIFYRRPLIRNFEGPEPNVDEPYSRLFSLIDELCVNDQILGNLAGIREQRAQQSRAFFARHADGMQLMQERIAEYQLYAEPVARLIDQLHSPQWRQAIEIGSGEGQFLAELAQRFDHVTAVDNSLEMLEKASQNCASLRTTSGCPVQFRHLDAAEAVAAGMKADLIVMNMVLHHVASPQSVISDSSRLLEPDGVLVVCDLNHHDQQWTRDACGDLWLGFDSAVLRQWAEACGLVTGESQYIGVRNGFQVQVHEFRKPAACRQY